MAVGTDVEKPANVVEFPNTWLEVYAWVLTVAAPEPEDEDVDTDGHILESDEEQCLESNPRKPGISKGKAPSTNPNTIANCHKL